MINNTWRFSSREEWRGLLGIMGSWEYKLRVKRWGRDLCWHGGLGVNQERGCSIGSNLPETSLVLALKVPHPGTPSVLVGCPLGHISSLHLQFPDHCLSSTPQNCAPHQVLVIPFKLSWDIQNVLLTPKICLHLLTDAWNHCDRTHGVPSHSQKGSTKEYTHYDSLYEKMRPGKIVFLRMLT